VRLTDGDGVGPCYDYPPADTRWRELSNAFAAAIYGSDEAFTRFVTDAIARADAAERPLDATSCDSDRKRKEPNR